MSTPLPVVPLDSYWGVIQAAVAARATTQVLFASVRLAADLAGEQLVPGSFQRMNQLRSLAVAQRNADASLARLTSDQAITFQQISTDINSRDALQRSLSPRYRVGFDVEGTRISSGASVRIRLTDTFGANLPATLGDLEAEVSAHAEGLAMDSDLALETVAGNFSIREV